MHPEDAQIEAFVMGSLDGGASAEFVEHVSSCDACAAKLQAEARLEVTLGEVARAAHHSINTPASLRPRMALLQAVAGLLLCVALLVGVRVIAKRVAVSSAPVAPTRVAHTSLPHANGPPPRLVNGDFEAPAGSASAPAGWSVSGTARRDYVATLDHEQHHSGKASVRFASKVESPVGGATLAQSLSALNLRGQRVRVTAFVKGKDVVAGSALRARVLTPASPDDGGGSCELSGTFNWKPCTIVFDVPPNGTSLQIGLQLEGRGTLWLDDVQLERIAAPGP